MGEASVEGVGRAELVAEGAGCAGGGRVLVSGCHRRGSCAAAPGPAPDAGRSRSRRCERLAEILGLSTSHAYKQLLTAHQLQAGDLVDLTEVHCPQLMSSNTHQ